MKMLRKTFFLLAAIPVFIILVWFFAVPDDLIKGKIEDGITNAGQGNIRASLTGLKKGPFFTLYADSLDLHFNNTPALTITDLSGFLNLGHLFYKRLSFSINGKIGTGNINGFFKYPAEGEIHIEKAELNHIGYLSRLGIKSSGYISANIILENKSARITFKVPDMDLQESTLIIPFINSFHRVQGALSVKGNNIKFDSVSLEGDKGYARLKGDIRNNMMDLRLELMPSMEKLNTVESMLIGKYIVSPGYYVIPIKGLMK